MTLRTFLRDALKPVEDHLVRYAISSCAALAVLCLTACGNGSPPASLSPGVAANAKWLQLGANKRPHASNVVVVIMENRDYDLIIGNSGAPFINGTLVPEAALMTNSHAIGHPSQPNYLAFFSGSTQGITDDSCPHSFSTVNIGEELLGANVAFTGYSESMPKDGYTGCSTNLYARKHNPWVNFTNVPASSNLIWYDIPGPDASSAPYLDIIVPNLCNDMHDCSTMTGDNWLKANVPTILQQLAATNGLFILTWDEAAPDANGTNQIATLLIGPMIVPGQYAQKINHYNVLHTMEKIFNVPCTANACKASPLKGMWQ
jgi:hypothetical protein